ncbi:unnamed protein product [Caenorhabditis bovis]|uniref:t-SNARE coiled-coil homology domain-containing protein n=1 Tax=Caenorhabditis bovis TaxID=2654633 RepID=A0A8S1EKV6_9PELO|nr:unnamed protein product [Caenorhabditis bovis]
MPRDRLAELREKAGVSENASLPRRRPSKNDDVTKPLIDPEADFEMFLQRCTNIREGMKSLNDDYEDIKQLHGKLLTTPGADAEFSKSLNQRTEVFISKFGQIGKSLEILKEETKNLPTATCGISRAKCEQVRSITKSLETIMLKFNKEQNDYKEKATKKITEYLKIRNIQLTDDEVEDAVNTGNLSDLTKGVMLALSEKKALYDDVKSRATEIKRLEEQIRRLADMFHDLHLLVVSQGEMLDRIENSVQNATEYATRARGNVEEARRLKKRAQKMKIIIIIISIVFFLILLLIVQAAICHFTPIC